MLATTTTATSDRPRDIMIWSLPEKNILTKRKIFVSLSPHELDIAEGGGVAGVVHEDVSVRRAEPEVWISEPLLLAGGGEQRDHRQVHHSTLKISL